MKNPSGQEIFQAMLAADPRYKEGAYEFVREALDFTLKKIAPSEDVRRHISGGELLDGARDYALQEFGPLAFRVLKSWGLNDTLDVGNVVFNMVNFKILGKNDDDSIRDFEGGYDFTDAFVTPFLPEPEPETSTVSEEAPARPRGKRSRKTTKD